MKFTSIDIAQVSQFSIRDRAYLTDASQFKEFVEYDFDWKAFKTIISDRNKFKTNRSLLSEVVNDQYKTLKPSTATKDLISQLADENTYTVTTAHQPSLLTGPLYYVHKILSTINVAQRLRKAFPASNFVPVFVLGSEDHDFEEINHLHLYGTKIEWQNNDKGSVGNFSTKGLNEVILSVKEKLGSSNKAEPILDGLLSQLTDCKNYGDFSFRLTFELFDHLGLVILNMSDKRLKAEFAPLIKKEIIEHFSQPLVQETQEKLTKEHGYKPQAHAREINLFYLNEAGRNRIEKTADGYRVLNTDQVFSESEILTEIERHPERFSPNVVMRPLYQDYILPNLAYIGGGGELAYWMERKNQFAAVGVPYPMLVRRQSAMIIEEKRQKQMDKIGLGITELFQSQDNLVKLLISKADQPDHELSRQKTELETLFKTIAEQAAKIDKTLEKTVGSESAKAAKSLDYLESKMRKALKQKEEVNINRLTKLKASLFPKGLQERHDNIFQYLAKYGAELIDEMLPQCDPFDKDFKVFHLE